MVSILSLKRVIGVAAIGFGVFGTVPVGAGEADIVDATARFNNGAWSFSVTVAHGDTGWDHYADQWVVANAETGKIYGVRELAHPHVEEQPFTRSLSGVTIPEGVETVVIRARDSVHGFGGKELRVTLER